CRTFGFQDDAESVASWWQRAAPAAITASGAEDHQNCLRLARSESHDEAGPAQEPKVRADDVLRLGLDERPFDRFPGLYDEVVCAHVADFEMRSTGFARLDRGSISNDAHREPSCGGTVADQITAAKRRGLGTATAGHVQHVADVDANRVGV